MVEIPLAVFLSAIVALVGAIGALFKLLDNARKDAIKMQTQLADERQARLTFVESKLLETEKREAESSRRESENAAMLRDLLDLTRAQTRGALPPRRPPMGSTPGR